MTGTSDVLTTVHQQVGTITLNRPGRINALTTQMMRTMAVTLDAWADDDRVERVEIRGAGERGLCAGADVRVMRDQILSGRADLALEFLMTEYDLDEQIYRFGKPITGHLVGIAMGGGLGLAQHTSRRIGGADTRWAMPETAIGLWPDVGVCFELSRAPGQSGAYLAMTGESIDGASASWAGFLDEAEGVTAEAVATSWLASNRAWIDECFVGDDAQQICQRLADHDSPQARSAAATIAQRSPLSVCLALEAVRRATRMADVAVVLDQDRVLGRTVCADPDDFVEGVRAKMVDKDRPRWRHASLAEVTRAEVLARFEG